MEIANVCVGFFFLPGEYLGDAAVRDAKLARNVTGTDAVVGQLDDPLADDIGQRSTVDKDSAELIDTSVTCPRRMVHYVVELR